VLRSVDRYPDAPGIRALGTRAVAVR